MRMNDRGLALLKEFESCVLHAYKDGGGVWTIGWGHTPAKPGETLSQFEADELLKLDLEEREAELTDLLEGVATTSNQFSAMLCLVYNIGFGDPDHVPPIPGLKTSTVLKRHRIGSYAGAADAFTRWRFDNGVPSRGLLRRREAEKALYLS